MNDKILKKLQDKKFYLENFCKIKIKQKKKKGEAPQRGLRPFVLNNSQKDLFNTLRKYNRIIILKARQLGFSTSVCGYFYVDTIMNPGTTTGLIGYNSELVSELLDKIKTFYKTTPAELRPEVHYDSKYQMSFPKMDSKIVVLPSTKDVGRGYTFDNLLVTELSSWDDAEEKMGGLEESVSEGGTIIIESSPRGAGNLFHRIYSNAKDVNDPDILQGDYVRREYGWWWGYSESEIEAKKRNKDPRWFAQEYALEFLTSGRPVFDIEVIKKQRKNILKVGNTNGTDKDGNEFKVYNEDGWIVYRDPEIDGMYVVGGDVSEGVEGGDYSVATIFNKRTGEEVAMYRGFLPPDRFGELLDKWGRRYNNALMVVEINNHGLTTITVLKQKIYPSLYFRPSKFETLSAGTTDRIGWKTTRVTRSLLIDELGIAIREDLIIHSKELLNEMMVFVYNDNGDMVSEHGFHDDTIFSAGIAYQGFKTLYSGKLTQINEQNHLPVNFAY